MLPGISVRLTPGHVPFHQAVLVQDGGETAAFIADLIPTVAHLPLPWIMGYDLEPLRTLESKRALLRDAVAGGWRLVFEHDPAIASGVAVAQGFQRSAASKSRFQNSLPRCFWSSGRVETTGAGTTAALTGPRTGPPSC